MLVQHFLHKTLRLTQIFNSSGTDVVIGYVLIAIGGINLLATQFQIANLYKTRFELKKSVTWENYNSLFEIDMQGREGTCSRDFTWYERFIMCYGIDYVRDLSLNIISDTLDWICCSNIGYFHSHNFLDAKNLDSQSITKRLSNGCNFAQSSL